MSMSAWRLGFGLLLIVLIGVAFGCGGGGGGSSPTAPEPPAPVTLSLFMETAHFLLEYNERDANKMDAYAAALEDNWRRIVRDLDQRGLPKITGRFYPDNASYQAATGWPSGGSVQGLTIFSVVAEPLQPDIPVHEFAHNVALHLDSECANNPTWLWEATAVWESEQFVVPASIPCLADGNFPSLSDLNTRGGDCDIYRVGYTITEFIVETYGMADYRALIVSHGDTESVLGLTTRQFERAWQEFVEERYL